LHNVFLRGEVACTITTAKTLDAALAKEVEGALGGFLKKGEKVLITYKVCLWDSHSLDWKSSGN
jgi:hypothetical protein